MFGPVFGRGWGGQEKPGLDKSMDAFVHNDTNIMREKKMERLFILNSNHFDHSPLILAKRNEEEEKK